MKAFLWPAAEMNVALRDEHVAIRDSHINVTALDALAISGCDYMELAHAT
jgi:hypothetical protein